MKTKNIFYSYAVSLLAANLFFAGVALAKDDMPDRTEDGLVRIDAKHVDAVYWQEGATLENYTKVMLVECAVAFKKNWMRDQNSSRIGLSDRVRPEDMDRIKKTLSAEFNIEFTKILEKGGYTVVHNIGDDVLLLRPAIVDLNVTAPDVKSVGRSRTYTASAGQMSLYMELYDPATGAKIGQVFDRQRARDSGSFSFSNSFTNRAEADRILRKWAELLVKALDEANSKSE